MKTTKIIFNERKIICFKMICLTLACGLFFATTLFAQADLRINERRTGSANLLNADFHKPNGSGTFYIISGNVKAGGANLSGATVALLFNSSITESAITDANGNYFLNALEGFSYTASVYKNGYNFNPSYQILDNVQSNQTVNFQNGTPLCVPAPASQTGENYCQTAIGTPVSTIQNGKIAFEIFGTTFAVNPNGTNQMQLPPAGSFPSWSPDGTKLLYNRTTSFDPDQEIYLMNADGTGNRQITSNFYNDYKANWSPDGRRAVFFRLFNSSDVEIFSINTDSPINGTNEVRLTNDDCVNQDPSYSPDGAKIVFVKNCENSDASGIYTINAADGSNPVQLTSGGVDLSPAWRPDGARIVFVRDGNLWRVNANGGGIIPLTFDFLLPYHSPVYSPDGAKIAFSRAPSETELQELYTLNPESGEQIRLTNNQQIPYNKEYPSWQRVVASVPVTLGGGLNLTFSNVLNGGNTVATPIAPASAGALPPGYFLIPESVAYDVHTSAQFAGNIEVCFNVPNINNQATFNNLVVFHGEGGVLIDRTSSHDFAARRICATVTSLSPFIVASPTAPTAASVTVSGRVLTPTGRGLMNAVVSMIDASGNTRTARTTTFGYFRFEAVEAGQTYIFDVRAKRYRFATQIVTINEELSELNFIAFL